MAPIRKGDGTPLEIPGVQEVRTGDGRLFFEADAIPDTAGSPINRWIMDEGEDTTFADSIGSADGSWFGGSWVADSAYSGGFGYQLNGVDDHGETNATMPSGSLTFAITVNPSSSEIAFKTLQGVFDGGSAGGRLLEFNDDEIENEPRVFVNNDNGDGFDCVSGQSISANNKHRVVGILDASVPEVSIAIDGSIVNSTSVSGSFETQLSNHKIGRRPDDASRFLDAVVDDALIDDQAWGEATVQDDYNNQLWS